MTNAIRPSIMDNDDIRKQAVWLIDGYKPTEAAKGVKKQSEHSRTATWSVCSGEAEENLGLRGIPLQYNATMWSSGQLGRLHDLRAVSFIVVQEDYPQKDSLKICGC